MGGKVRVFSRTSSKLIEMKKKYKDIEIMVGDVTDKLEVAAAYRDVKGVFHLAALAQSMQSGGARESIHTNLIGSMNVLPITPENGEEIIKWPKKLINKVIESMDRKIDRRAGEKYLGNLGWSKGLMNCLFRSCDKIPIRFYIVDDSGSMNQSDGQRILGHGKDQKLVKGSRWSELMDCIYFAANLAEEVGAPTEFRLLNGSDPVMVGLKECCKEI